MAKLQQVVDLTNFHLEKCKFVLKHFPDASSKKNIYSNKFSSKKVNSVYDKFQFVQCRNAIYVIPYVEIKFSYNGVEELIRVDSCPRYNRLAYIVRKSRNDKPIIKFSRLASNLKNNNLKEDVLNSCRIEILNFITTHTECSLDPKHLEPRLKKLLLFI